ncbi:hypothetical protein C8R47DRAFT_1176404 [Mycena vitilis]|nr:hypothetical protein C8R47DRAFT_1176404 [Mycena vitilis]
MFAASTVLFVFSLWCLVSAKPLSYRREQALGFDDFNGQDNFDGGKNDQTVVVKEVQTKCETVKIEIVQQKLAILQELVKRIITEQICDVQTQTIVLEQHNGSVASCHDLQHQAETLQGTQIGFDESIAQKITQVVNTDGTLSVNDNGFSGSDVGKNTVVPVGNNWDNSTSPTLVQAALDAARSAINSTSSQ